MLGREGQPERGVLSEGVTGKGTFRARSSSSLEVVRLPRGGGGGGGVPRLFDGDLCKMIGVSTGVKPLLRAEENAPDSGDGRDGDAGTKGDAARIGGGMGAGRLKSGVGLIGGGGTGRPRIVVIDPEAHRWRGWTAANARGCG